MVEPTVEDGQPVTKKVELPTAQPADAKPAEAEPTDAKPAEAKPAKDAGRSGKAELTRSDGGKRAKETHYRAITYDPPLWAPRPADKPKDNTGNGAATSSGTSESSRQAANTAPAQAPPAAVQPKPVGTGGRAVWHPPDIVQTVTVPNEPP